MNNTEEIDVRIKISVLWLISEVVGLAGALLAFAEPGILTQIINGELEGLAITPELLLVLAALLLVPLIMAFLTLTLKDKTNRWTNLILSIIWSILPITDLPRYTANPSASGILLWLSGIIATVLIIWYAYTWPTKQT